MLLSQWVTPRASPDAWDGTPREVDHWAIECCLSGECSTLAFEVALDIYPFILITREILLIYREIVPPANLIQLFHCLQDAVCNY